jgi:hypothetical protein
MARAFISHAAANSGSASPDKAITGTGNVPFAACSCPHPTPTLIIAHASRNVYVGFAGGSSSIRYRCSGAAKTRQVRRDFLVRFFAIYGLQKGGPPF